MPSLVNDVVGVLRADHVVERTVINREVVGLIVAQQSQFYETGLFLEEVDHFGLDLAGIGHTDLNDVVEVVGGILNHIGQRRQTGVF